MEVSNRRQETLRDLTTQWLLPGTHIVSDGWRAYDNIENWANGIYTHSVIVHNENFVDPNDDEIHTQNVENMWMRMKRKMRRQFGTNDNLFESYLYEFVWRNTIQNDKPLSHFILLLRDIYVV